MTKLKTQAVTMKFLRILLYCLVFGQPVAHATELRLSLSCMIEAAYDAVDTNKFYAARESWVDKDRPRVFTITATHHKTLSRDGGVRHSNSNSTIGSLSGDFTYLIEGNVIEWWEFPDKYQFLTRKDFEGRNHFVVINRISGRLIHFAHFSDPNGRITGGTTYEYSNCKLVKAQF